MQPRRPTNRPVPGGSRPAPRPQQAQTYLDDEGPVEVSAQFMHGPRTNSNALLKTVFFVVMGLAMAGILFLIVSNLSSGRSEEQRKQKEEVQSLPDFEKAIDRARANIATVIARYPKVEITETSDFSEATNAFAAHSLGGRVPWATPPRPGNPLRSYSFMLKHKDDFRNVHYGYIVILYYRTAQEVSQAEETLKAQCASPAKFCGYSVNPALWCASYQGVNWTGPVADAIEAIRAASLPSDFKQFTKRVGAE